MGNFKEHLLFGALVATLTAYLFNHYIHLTLSEKIIALILVFAGSVLPDIDHKNSYVFRATKATLSTGTAVLTILLTNLEFVYRYLLAAIAFSTVYFSLSLIKMNHRGFTHTITFALMLTAISTAFANLLLNQPVIGLGLTVGVFSHLILDGEFKFSP